MGTMIKILGLMQEQIVLIGEIAQLKVLLAESRVKMELRIHERDKHQWVWGCDSQLARERELQAEIEEKQAKLNISISEVAKLQRELIGG